MTKLHEALQDYLDGRARAGRVTGQTLKTWDSVVKLTRRFFPDVELSKLTREVLDKGFAALTKQGYAPKTMQGVYDFLRLVLNDAVEQGTLVRSPLRWVDRPKAAKRKNGNLPNDVLATLLSCAATDEVAGPAVRLALATGFRRAEIAALKWEDWDFLRKTVTVQRGKTPSAKRTVAVPDVIVKEFIARRQNSYSDFCFWNSTRGQISPDVLGIQIKSLMRRAGLPEEYTLHSLRHTHASRLLNAGMSLPNVSRRLGHSSPAVTMSVYAHANEEDDRLLADAIGQVLT